VTGTLAFVLDRFCAKISIGRSDFPMAKPFEGEQANVWGFNFREGTLGV
jgi:hypothetical protein